MLARYVAFGVYRDHGGNHVVFRGEEKLRPAYRREGHMLVTAHAHGRAVIAARSTCGGHAATATVEVTGE